MWGREAVPIARVEPELVVEVLADTAVQGCHLRHLARFVRVRPDLDAAELDGWQIQQQEPK